MGATGSATAGTAGAAAAASTKATPEKYNALEDLECLGRCAGSSRIPGDAEKAAFLRFRSHEAPLLEEAALREAVAAVKGLPTQRWPPPPGDRGLPSLAVVADRARAGLLGAALADACGLATEFLSQARAEAFYGEGFAFRPGCDVFPDTHRAFFPPGDWTDDTDQALLVLQSLLAAGGAADQRDFAVRLRRWAREGFGELGDRCGSGLGKTVSKVVQAAGFEEAPVDAAREVWEANQRNLAANGAVMRVAPCGFPCFWDLDATEELAKAFCQVTHFDDRCVASCVCVAVAAACLLQGKGALEAASEGVERARKHLEEQHMEQFQWYAAAERSLDELTLDEPHSIGYTFKAMACGLIALRAEGRPFEDVVRDIVRRGGDADTNAVVAGALLGCARGSRGLPADWLREMPYLDWLEAWAEKPGHAWAPAGP